MNTELRVSMMALKNPTQTERSAFATRDQWPATGGAEAATNGRRGDGRARKGTNFGVNMKPAEVGCNCLHVGVCTSRAVVGGPGLYLAGLSYLQTAQEEPCRVKNC